jgi:hypothetical protein
MIAMTRPGVIALLMMRMPPGHSVGEPGPGILERAVAHRGTGLRSGTFC